MASSLSGSGLNDNALLGRGVQNVQMGAGDDLILSYGDGGEPDPAQTDGSAGRVTATVRGSSNNTLTGGAGADRFEFRALLNARTEVIATHTDASGHVNWAAVAGENDNVHDHWVEGFGQDTITDFSKAEGDTLKIAGHTMTLDGITYGIDAGGAFSLISVISQQGNGGAGGANTATGAHDEDPLGQIKVYGDRVVPRDVEIERTNDGIDRLIHADDVYAPLGAGVTQVVASNTAGTVYGGSPYRQTDVVTIGAGGQTVHTGGGTDIIFSFSDGGEPDPAQTNGADGRVTPPVAARQTDDVIAGGQGADTFAFRLLLNARAEVLAESTRSDGSVNWRKVAGENDTVHDHWVEGIGNDVILDFSAQDGDKIDIRGHTVEVASLTHGADGVGDFSLIHLRSQQGDGGAGGTNTATGAHDEDPLGTIKIYGDRVTEADITLKANAFYGSDMLDQIAAAEAAGFANTVASAVDNPIWGLVSPGAVVRSFVGTSQRDMIKAGSGTQIVVAGDGNDHILSTGDAGEPDPAQTIGASGRMNPALGVAASNDFFTGGAGADTFEFRALLNATAEVVAQHTSLTGGIHWRGVAGENDNVHDHWVEGFGFDTILDYSKSEGDQIALRGHTVELENITYGTDSGGTYSLISVISQQGNGGAGGANTATGAHDEDPLGQIKVYGDRVIRSDVSVQRDGVFDGGDQLARIDRLLDFNGGVQTFATTAHNGRIMTAPPDIETMDHIEIGSGAQFVEAGLGRDVIRLYADGGEPDPARGDATQRATDPLAPRLSADTVLGGQDRDHFVFTYLLDATDVVLARHTREDGSINWRAVAGENDAVHDHWVTSGGTDVILDFSKQDDDLIEVRGHTVELARITHGADAEGDFSMLQIRAQQGPGGGAHDEDALGTVKVYGDKVTRADVKVTANGVFDGIDIFEPFDDLPHHIVGGDQGDRLSGTAEADNIHGMHGDDIVFGHEGRDYVFGGGGNDILKGGTNADWIEGGQGRDAIFGEGGADTLVSTGGQDSLLGGRGADTFVFMDGSRGGQILDWEDGIETIDFSRMAAVQRIGDLALTRLSEASFSVAFTNDAGKAGTIDVFGADGFALTTADFAF